MRNRWKNALKVTGTAGVLAVLVSLTLAGSNVLGVLANNETSLINGSIFSNNTENGSVFNGTFGNNTEYGGIYNGTFGNNTEYGGIYNGTFGNNTEYGGIYNGTFGNNTEYGSVFNGTSANSNITNVTGDTGSDNGGNTTGDDNSQNSTDVVVDENTTSPVSNETTVGDDNTTGDDSNTTGDDTTPAEGGSDDTNTTGDDTTPAEGGSDDTNTTGDDTTPAEGGDDSSSDKKKEKDDDPGRFATPDDTPEAQLLAAALDALDARGDNAIEPGSGLKVLRTLWLNSYPRSFMRKIDKYVQIGYNVVFINQYQGEDHIVLIPAGMPVNLVVDWSGPAFMSQEYVDISALVKAAGGDLSIANALKVLAETGYEIHFADDTVVK